MTAISFHFFFLREFVFWHLPQLQYKNPNVQVVTFKNMTPTPFIRCYYGMYLLHIQLIYLYVYFLSITVSFPDNGDDMLIDIDSQNKEDILSHLISVVGKSK